MKEKLKSTRNPVSVFSVVCLIILIIYSFFILFLVGWGFLKSLQTNRDFILAEYPYSGIPGEFTFDNYISAFEKIQYTLPSEKGGYTVYFLEMLFNSVLYSVGGSIVFVTTCCVVAYLTSKYDNKFNIVIDGIFYFTLLFPIVGSTPSTIQVMKTLGILDTWLGIFLQKLHFSGTAYLIFKATFKTLDNGYAEAAKMDGASHFAIMTKIIMPLVRTTITILFVINFIALWNDYQVPMLFLESHPTASYGMYLFNKAGSSYEDRLIYKMAGFMILIIPTFIVFLIMKDKMIGNLTIGGLKG